MEHKRKKEIYISGESGAVHIVGGLDIVYCNTSDWARESCFEAQKTKKGPRDSKPIAFDLETSSDPLKRGAYVQKKRELYRNELFQKSEELKQSEDNPSGLLKRRAQWKKALDKLVHTKKYTS